MPTLRIAEVDARCRTRSARHFRVALLSAAALLAATALMPRAASDRPVLASAVRAQIPPAGASGFEPGRPQTFVWPAVAGARAYEVRLFRGAEQILVARTTEPRLRLAKRWTYGSRSFTLMQGSYRWEVRPLSAGGAAKPAGAPTVQARLVVK